jgi:plasmid maintenance system antidote protein VapI
MNMAKKTARKTTTSAGRKQSSLGDQLRKAIKDSGLTVYAVAKGSGLSQSVTLRFVAQQRDVTLTSATKLAHFFGMEFTEPKLR